MSVSCRAHGCIFLSFLLKRQKITTVGSEQPENITFHGKRQKKSAMGRSVPKRWAQVDFTVPLLPTLPVAALQRAGIAGPAAASMLEIDIPLFRGALVAPLLLG